MVIGENKEQLGVISISDALLRAKESDLDLVEVSPTSNPPVCRIMDYGKFKYKQAKKEQESKKKQKIIHVKEIKLRPKIEEHDYQFKVKHVKRFLADGDKAKVTINFRGREAAHKFLGKNILERIIEELKDIGSVEQPPTVLGRNMFMIMAPK